MFKTASKRACQKTAEATGDFIGNKIAYYLKILATVKLRKFQKTHNKTIQRQLQKRIKKYLEKDISPEERQKIIDDLRLI